MTPRREDGFALVTTLWLLALLALVAVIVEGWISTALERAFALQERTETRAALIGATDRLAFLMATSGFSARGLELVPQASSAPRTGASLPPRSPYIALDGRPYRPTQRTGGLICAPDETSWHEARDGLLGR